MDERWVADCPFCAAGEPCPELVEWRNPWMFVPAVLIGLALWALIIVGCSWAASELVWRLNL